MDIRPIRTRKDHKAALTQIEALWNAKAGSREHERLDVLTTLVEAYERTHLAMPSLDPIEAIRFRMEQLGLSRADLEPMIGSRARVSEIFSGKRSLTLPMIRALHAQLGIPAEVLIGAANEAA
jgi:HTH-type transcriptional regulator/antitoxin HigA